VVGIEFGWSCIRQHRWRRVEIRQACHPAPALALYRDSAGLHPAASLAAVSSLGGLASGSGGLLEELELQPAVEYGQRRQVNESVLQVLVLGRCVEKCFHRGGHLQRYLCHRLIPAGAHPARKHDSTHTTKDQDLQHTLVDRGGVGRTHRRLQFKFFQHPPLPDASPPKLDTAPAMLPDASLPNLDIAPVQVPDASLPNLDTAPAMLPDATPPKLDTNPPDAPAESSASDRRGRRQRGWNRRNRGSDGSVDRPSTGPDAADTSGDGGSEDGGDGGVACATPKATWSIMCRPFGISRGTRMEA